MRNCWIGTAQKGFTGKSRRSERKMTNGKYRSKKHWYSPSLSESGRAEDYKLAQHEAANYANGALGEINGS
jgi:hypothetical protein